MRRDDLIGMRHMLDAGRDALSFVIGKRREDLDQDRMLTFALARAAEVIGEAASKVSRGTQESFSEIPWQQIIDRRNLLIHGYDDINLDILWETITVVLPPLMQTLERIMASEPPDYLGKSLIESALRRRADLPTTRSDSMDRQRPDIPKGLIKEFCRKYHIRKLSIFGSYLRDDFGPESDIDFLVEFEPDHIPGLIAFAGMEIELSEILGRKVDLRTAQDLSRYFRDEVVAQAEVQYAEG